MKKVVASNGSYIESASVTYSPDSIDVCTSCLICGESVPVYGNRPEPKICADCKRAVLTMREAIKKPPEDIVRCKDCRYWKNQETSTAWLPCMEIMTGRNWFCANGEKKVTK